MGERRKRRKKNIKMTGSHTIKKDKKTDIETNIICKNMIKRGNQTKERQRMKAKEM